MKLQNSMLFFTNTLTYTHTHTIYQISLGLISLLLSANSRTKQVNYGVCLLLFLLEYEGGVDKSLAWPGSKQATATKLEIYSTYSPRSSIHILARCSNFCKPLKKNSECCPSNQVPEAAMTSASDQKWRLSIVFSVQGTGGSPTGTDPENRVGDQDIGSPGRPVSSGLQVPGERGHCRARIRPPWWNSRGVFPSKCPSIAPTEISNTPRW